MRQIAAAAQRRCRQQGLLRRRRAAWWWRRNLALVHAAGPRRAWSAVIQCKLVQTRRAAVAVDVSW